LRARTDAGYGENVTLTTTQPTTAAVVGQSSALSGGHLASVIVGIVGGVGWIIIAIIICYIVKHRCNKRGTYKPTASGGAQQSQPEIYQNSFELQSGPQEMEEHDDDEKPPLDIDEPDSERTTKI
jgi:hypothetical protein